MLVVADTSPLNYLVWIESAEILPQLYGCHLDLTLHAEPHSLEVMEVQFTPELEQQLLDLAAATGRSTGELVQDSTVGYLGELSTIQKLIDSRYDEIKSGRIQLVDGVSFFETLRIQETEQLSKRSCRTFPNLR